MTEKLLQFIWHLQYFNPSSLKTTADEDIRVISPGQLNKEQGPDFRDAKIRIGNTTWAGSVELHLKTSDWNRHGHEEDANYQNVVLHVVWENDAGVNNIPVLELQTGVSRLLLTRYEELMQLENFIPCEKMIADIPGLIWKGWKERLLIERLIRKAGRMEELLQTSDSHWEETFWHSLARSFGMKTNADAFETIASTVPLSILAKHKHQVQQLEALLLGQAGLLEKKMTDQYSRLLQREYRFLKKKYRLKPITVPVHFLRMRPSNFPSLRLAQLAMLVYHSAHLFSRVRDAGSLRELRKWFDITANDYWLYHYRLNVSSAYKKKNIGDTLVDHIIINSIGPILFAYGHYHDEMGYKQKALDWLDEMNGESNNITRGFARLGINCKTASDSQALLELKTRYCDKRRCLECSIGAAILNNAGQAHSPQSTVTSISG